MINWLTPFVEFLGAVDPSSWLVSFLAFAIVAALFVILRGAIDV